MRHFLAPALLLLCMSLPAASQPLRQWGLKFGPSISSITWDVSGIPDNTLQSRLCVDAAAYGEWLNLPVFSIVSELHYLQRGFRADDPMVSRAILPSTEVLYHYRYNVRLDYLSFALLPKVRLERETFDFYALAGLHLDMRLSHSASVEPGDRNHDTWSTGFAYQMDRLLEDSRKTVLGATFGIGVEVKSLLPLGAGLEVRYSPSLQDLYSGGPFDISSGAFEFLLTLSR